ncbi:MAG: ion transporter [Marinilabiliales bacterium]
MKKFKEKLFTIVFEADTVAGKIFDIALIVLILISVILVLLESVQKINHNFREFFRVIEWTITILFTIEYFLRIWLTKKPLKYIFSFYGIVDFLAILPSFIGVFISGAHGLMTIRTLRVLRIFRIFKATRYISASTLIIRALKSSWAKISVFLLTIAMLLVIIGTLMYLIEGPENGFTDIPTSIYWAVVTLTTVGYGDISPKTPIGQFFSSIVMIIGYAIIAVPTGIVSFEMVRENKASTQVCPHCMKEGHDNDAEYCKYCGSKLNE